MCHVATIEQLLSCDIVRPSICLKDCHIAIAVMLDLRSWNSKHCWIKFITENIYNIIKPLYSRLNHGFLVVIIIKVRNCFLGNQGKSLGQIVNVWKWTPNQTFVPSVSVTIVWFGVLPRLEHHLLSKGRIIRVKIHRRFTQF